jgi:phage major capsid protein, HK97 family
MSNQIVEAIDKVAQTFETFKEVSEQQLAEAEKKHASRASELAQTLEKISADLDASVKERRLLEAKFKAHQDRVEILEALQDRPRGTVQEKAKNELAESFAKCVRSGFKDMQANHDYKQSLAKAVEVKAVNITTAAEGGYAVPEEISRNIESLILKQSDVLADVKMVQVGTSDYKELVSIHGTSSAWSTESGSRSETGIANLRERAPTWGELYAYPKVSNWSLEDIFFNVVDWLTNDAAQGMSKNLDSAVYSGNGSGKPTGIFNGAPVTTADYASPLRAAAVIQYVKADAKSPQQVNADDLIDLVYTLAPGYRSNAKFYMNTVTQGHVRKLKDTTNNYIWQPSLQAGQPDRLLGYEVRTWEDLGNPTTDGAYPAVFGDMRRAYLLTSRTGLAIDQNPYAAIGYTSFYIRKRYGGCVLNNDAIKVLKIED